MPPLVNLVGKTFGTLTVVEKAPSKNGHVYWVCDCSCGNTGYVVQGNHLKDGRTSNCPKCRTQQRKEQCQTKMQIRKCKICEKEFVPNNGARVYCYECSPEQQDRASAITCIRRAIKKQLVKYKGGRCIRCGYNKTISALDFHHKDSQEKDFNLSDAYNRGCVDMKKLYQEVDKCDLLCANCHREVHDEENIGTLA